jgi:hypothetical protein
MTKILTTPFGATRANGKFTYYALTDDNPTTFSWFSPYLGGGIIGNLRQHCFLSDLRAGWGWGWGWLGSPLFSVLANVRAGSGGRRQPLHMTKYLHILGSVP